MSAHVIEAILTQDEPAIVGDDLPRVGSRQSSAPVLHLVISRPNANRQFGAQTANLERLSLRKARTRPSRSGLWR